MEEILNKAIIEGKKEIEEAEDLQVRKKTMKDTAEKEI